MLSQLPTLMWGIKDFWNPIECFSSILKNPNSTKPNIPLQPYFISQTSLLDCYITLHQPAFSLQMLQQALASLRLPHCCPACNFSHCVIWLAHLGPSSLSFKLVTFAEKTSLTIWSLPPLGILPLTKASSFLVCGVIVCLFVVYLCKVCVSHETCKLP